MDVHVAVVYCQNCARGWLSAFRFESYGNNFKLSVDLYTVYTSGSELEVHEPLIKWPTETLELKLSICIVCFTYLHKSALTRPYLYLGNIAAILFHYLMLMMHFYNHFNADLRFCSS